MPLLISLSRETQQEHDLGSHEAVELTIDEMRVASGGALLAKHRHNRWMPAENPEPYARLHIDGPLSITGLKPDDRVLGPYQDFAMFDGVGYVENRVFAFTDLQQQDWYVHDVGRHWPCIRINFHRTGP
jgi:hypothetical protein